MPSSRPQVFGLSKDVTLAVLPRLYMQEVLIELGRRDIDFRQVLITTLHDVMVREYQQLDSQSEPTTPDVTCHVTRRVGYGFYDPSPWAGELVGRRGVPVDRYIESYRGDTHMDTPTDLSMRSVDREEVREQERRDTKESYQIVTARRTDQERWSHAHAYTEYTTHRQEMSHDHMPQEAENREIFDRPSSEDEDKSPLERRDEYGRDPSTSSVSQDEEYRCREQEENNATLSSEASASPDTRPPDRHSQSSIAETCTAPQETPTSQYQNQSEVNVSDTANRPTSLGSRFIYRKSGRSYSRKKITHNLPTLPVPQQPISSSQTQTETEDGPLRFSAASMQRMPRGKRKTDKKDVCKSIATVPADEATSSKRSKRHDSGDLTVHHANGQTENDISPAYQRPSEDKIVQYRDLSVDAPQILPYWTQPKSPSLHIEWVSSISKDSAASWKKDSEEERKSEKDPSDRKSSTPHETSEDSAATASDFSKPASSAMPNVAATHRHPLQVDGGATKHKSRPPQLQKMTVAYPRQQESNRAPAEQEHEQDRSTIPREEASPTVRQGDNGDSPTSQSSLPAVLQEPGGSSHKRESISQTRESSLPVKLRQFILPGMRKQNNRDTYMSSSATSQMPFEAIDSYHREEESGRKHLRTSKDIVASFGRQDETHLQGLSGTKVDTNLPCSRSQENCDENSHERMTLDIANSNRKEPETMGKNASGSVLSSVFHEAPIYKRLEEHRSRPSMNLQSSSMPPEPIGYAERQLQRSDTSSVPRPLIPSYHGQGGRSSTEAHMEPVLSELAPSSERQLNHQTAQLCESSIAFPYRRRNGESSVTQPHDGPPSTVSTSLETLPGFQKLVQINGSTVWVPRTFDSISPLTYPPVHVNPGDTAHLHQSSPSSHQVENIEKHPQGEPVPMESHEAMPARHQVDNTRVNPRESQTSEEQYAYQEQPPDFLTQGELSIVIKKEPLSPLSDSVNEEERELIQGVLSGASLTESLEQQMLNSGDAPRGTEGENLERPPGSEHETGADEGSSSATSEVSDGSRKWRKLYHCPLCSYFTRHRGNVKQHVRVHTRERPFKCPMCDYTGARKEHVQVHMKRHTGERPFKCDHCEYRTSRKPDLVKHLRTHSGDRPYACPKCAYRAAVQSALVNHLRTHTGEKPYKCPFCSHSTARRRELFKHMGRHSEEERNYAVELYGKR